MLNSTATKIEIIEKEGKKSATAVRFIQKHDGNDIERIVKVTKEVIVSGGAVNSPQLLLLSGVGPKEDLDRVGITQVHELPGVGRNLHNHVGFNVYFQLLKEPDVYVLNNETLEQYLHHDGGPMSSSGLAQLTGRLNTKYSEDENYPDLQFMFDGYWARCSPNGEEDELVDGVERPREIAVVPLLLRAKSRGYLTLNSSDPLEHPLIYGNYLTEDIDILTMVEGVRLVQKISKAEVLKQKYNIVPKNVTYGDCNDRYDDDSDEFWKCAIRYATDPQNHQAGSCKMGPKSDKYAVVNPKLQVHGIPNVRVMDASVMPFMVSANPHANIVMIAERGAKFVKELWQSAAKY